MEAVGGVEEGELLRLAACVERGSSHPLAAAIIGLAAARGLPLSDPVTDSQLLAGQVRISRQGIGFWVWVPSRHTCQPADR